MANWKNFQAQVNTKFRQAFQHPTFKQFDQKSFLIQKRDAEKHFNRFWQQQQSTFKSLFSSRGPLLSRHSKNLSNSIIRDPRYQKFERWWQTSPCPATVVLLGVNCLVFLMWKISTPSLYDPVTNVTIRKGIIPRPFMQRHFTCSWNSLSEWRFYSLITANFSHIDARHFVFSVVTTYFMGSSLERIIGPEKLIAVYLVAGVLSVLCQAAAEKRNHTTRTPICGASGSLAAIMTMLAIKAPMDTVLIYGIVPVPMCVMVLGFLGYDVFNRGVNDGIGHEAHIGGALAGALIHFLRRA